LNKFTITKFDCYEIKQRDKEFSHINKETAENFDAQAKKIEEIMDKSEKYKDIDLDAPEPWGIFFQDNATPQMEGLEELHNNIMFYLAIILFAVT
jgi:hypothetical protein